MDQINLGCSGSTDDCSSLAALEVPPGGAIFARAGAPPGVELDFWGEISYIEHTSAPPLVAEGSPRTIWMGRRLRRSPFPSRSLTNRIRRRAAARRTGSVIRLWLYGRRGAGCGDECGPRATRSLHSTAGTSRS